MADRPVSRETTPSASGESKASGIAFRLPTPGEVVASKYRIEATLGAGGMGVVLLAENLGIGQKVAIKFVSESHGQRREEATARLVREARAAAGLRGEHVVRVYDVGESDRGAPFIVMELLEGLDLGEIIGKGSPLAIADAVGLLVQACRGVEEAHRAGIVHRDLKPSNLFIVRRQDGKACLKVLDFGISKWLAKDAAEPKTLTGSLVALGSPHYMSPEQVRDARNVDVRTDIWSMGVILYQMLTGKPAFSADTFPGIYAAIAADTPASPRSLRPEIPAALERVVWSCLERDAAARFQRVEELRRALEPFCATEPDFDALLSHRDPETLVRRGDSGASLAGAVPGSTGVRAALLEDAAHTQVSLGALGAYLEDETLGDSTQRSPSETRAEPVSPARRKLVLWFGAFALLGLVLLSRSFGQADKNVAPASVTLSFESRPSGARVREGEKLHGTTPLELEIPADAGRLSRHFAVELSGYRPYRVEHRAQQGSIRIRAELIPELLGAPIASTPAIGPVSTRKPTPKPLSPRPSASVDQKPLTQEAGIRLQR